MKKIEYVLWAVKIGTPDYLERVLFVNDAPIDISNPKLIELAKQKGFHKLRTSVIDITQKPNFINTIN